MVLEIKLPAEGIETEVLRPRLFISKPTRQLRNENLLAQFLQDFADVLLRVTLRNAARIREYHPRVRRPSRFFLTALSNARPTLCSSLLFC
jgi:hypothetical protein